MIRSFLFLFAAALLSTSPALADPPSLAGGTVLDAVEDLEAGDFLWAPELAPAGPVTVMINRRTQRLIVYRNAIPIGISTVSTGRPSHRTPTGMFTVLQKRQVHFSSTYNNAPMPYMQRLTSRGIALHGGELPGYPASHGCIRLPHQFAQLLFGVTRIGTPVVITDRPAMPRLGLSTDANAANRELARHSNAGPMIWEPQRGREGPVTLVASIADSRILVIRGGHIIGSAPLTAPSLQTLTAFVLTTAGSNPQWHRIALTGQPGGEAGIPDPLGLVSLEQPFRAAIEPLLVQGTTMLLVPDSLRGS